MLKGNDPYHVLIADDELLSRTVLQNTFRKQGFEAAGLVDSTRYLF